MIKTKQDKVNEINTKIKSKDIVTQTAGDRNTKFPCLNLTV